MGRSGTCPDVATIGQLCTVALAKKRAALLGFAPADRARLDRLFVI